MVYKLNVRKSLPDKRDYLYKNIIKNEKLYHFPETYLLGKYIKGVRNQGNQGSCFAFSVACLKEFQEKKENNFGGYFSPQFFYDHRSNLKDNDPNNDEGMYGRSAMKLLQNIGICEENDYKYGDINKISKLGSGDRNNLYQKSKKNVIKSYAKIESITELKSALYKHGPCIICLPVYSNKERMWKKRVGNKLRGGHAMPIIGYNEGGFIIKNSWGKDWGTNGFCIFPYTDWGCQWEIWTTIDKNIENPNPVPKPSFINRYFKCFST